MKDKKENTNRNIDINHDTWAKVGVMAATMNKSKKMVVDEAIRFYFEGVKAHFPEMKK
jgi:hypothetical protein